MADVLENGVSHFYVPKRKRDLILSVIIFLFSVKSFFHGIEPAFFAAVDGPVGGGGQVVHGCEGCPVGVVLAG